MSGKRLKLASALVTVRADRLLGRRSPTLLVLNYHRLHASAERPRSRFDDGVFGPDVRTFRRQMEWLKAATVVLNEENLLSAGTGGRLPRGTVYSAVTFDDAYVDCYTLAKPVLDELDIQGMFFVPVEMIESRRLGWWDVAAHLLKQTQLHAISLNGELFDLRGDFAGSLKRLLAMFKLESADKTVGLLDALSAACDVKPPTRDEQSAELMSWKQVREMRAAGHAIGSHSLSHRVLATLDPAEQAREIHGSRKELEAVLGGSVASFAYPVGGPAHINHHSVTLAEEAGYQQAFTFNTGIASVPVQDHFRIPRESADSLEMLKAKAKLPRVMGLSVA